MVFYRKRENSISCSPEISLSMRLFYTVQYTLFYLIFRHILLLSSSSTDSLSRIRYEKSGKIYPRDSRGRNRYPASLRDPQNLVALPIRSCGLKNCELRSGSRTFRGPSSPNHGTDHQRTKRTRVSLSGGAPHGRPRHATPLAVKTELQWEPRLRHQRNSDCLISQSGPCR